MRFAFGALVFAAACTGSSPTAGLLGTACTSDSQCAGSPCYHAANDPAGTSFCGAPCGSCPFGYSCQTVTPLMGANVRTCYPDNGSFVASPLPDMAMPPPGDGGAHDLATPSGDLGTVVCTPPSSTGVSASGGTVDRLFFGFTGDTRPMNSESHYDSSLQTVINNIFTQMGQRGVQFAIDQGDHMEPSGSTGPANQIGDYLNAAALLGKPIFMTMGNHECSTSSAATGPLCSSDCSDIRCSAFLNGLKSSGVSTSKPYYRFDIMTGTGLAVFIVIADDVWDSTEQAWLHTQLTDADARAKFTFVSRHHPIGNTDYAVFADIDNMVRVSDNGVKHKYTLYLTGHSHEYKREGQDPRAIRMGIGGAPFDGSGTYWGYGTVMQCPDDHFYVTIYDQATGMATTSFNVSPQ